MRFVLVVTLLTSALACGDSGGPPNGGGACGPVVADELYPNRLPLAITQPATLKKSCSPYNLREPLVIGAEVTIEPGVEIVACQGGCRSRITVNKDGRLIASGTAAEPIVFTSTARDTGETLGGQWTGILFLESPAGSVLENVIVEFAGANWEPAPDDDVTNLYDFPVEGAILNDSSPNVAVSDVTVRKSNAYAVALSTTSAFEEAGELAFSVLDRLTLHDNFRGLWIPLDQVGSLGADICFVQRNEDGTCPDVPAPMGVYVEAHPDSLLMRTPEVVLRDATWKPFKAPYKVDYIDIKNNSLLVIEDGVELRMTGFGGIAVGVNDFGALQMIAAEPGGIRVRHISDTPNMNDFWDGMYFGSDTDSQRTEIRNVDLGYGGLRTIFGGSEAPAIIGISDSAPKIYGNHVHHSAGAGIHWNCLANPPGLEDGNDGGNTGEDATIRCAAAIGSSVAENWGEACPGAGDIDKCKNP